MFPATFPRKTEVSTLVDVMVEADIHFDNLKLIQKTRYQISSSHPDLNPGHEALLLEELFKELNRSGESRNHSEDFQMQLNRAEKQMTELPAALETTTAKVSDSDVKLAAAFNNSGAILRVVSQGASKLIPAAQTLADELFAQTFSGVLDIAAYRKSG